MKTTQSKTPHWSELPALGTLGGWNMGLSTRSVQAYQWLVVRHGREYIDSIVRAAQRLNKDVGATLERVAENAWAEQERAA